MFKRTHKPEWDTLEDDIATFEVVIENIPGQWPWTYSVHARNVGGIGRHYFRRHAKTEASARWHAEQEVENGRRLVAEARERRAQRVKLTYTVDPAGPDADDQK